jgi:hypothetical protein
MSTGAKTFTVDSGKAFVVGMKVLISRIAAPTTTYMYGTVTGYSSTTLHVTVAGYIGSGGPFTDWVISGTGSVVIPTAGSGITVGTTNALQPSISHSDTSSQGSVNNSGATVIQDVNLDGFGHVIELVSATLAASTVGALPTAGGTMTGNIVMGSYQLRYDAGTYHNMGNGYHYFFNDGANDYLVLQGGVGSTGASIACVVTGWGTGSDGRGLQIADASGGWRARYYADNSGARITGSSAINFKAADRMMMFDRVADRFYPYGAGIDLGMNSLSYCWDNIYYSGEIWDISDERLKNISKSFPSASWVYSLTPIEFTWKDKALGTKKKVGFSAQQVYSVLPAALKDNSTIVQKTPTEDGKDYNWSMSKVELIPYLVKIIQDQKNMINELTLRVKALEDKQQ